MVLPILPSLSLSESPPVGFYFMVTFFIGEIVPNPIDIRFQKVSGMTSTIETTEIKEGGENLFVNKVPNRITYGDLVLERGMVFTSPLTIEFNVAMSSLRFQPSNIIVMLLNEKNTPTAGWLCQKAYPLEWTISDLDANQNSVVIETMKLTYSRLQNLRI